MNARGRVLAASLAALVAAGGAGRLQAAEKRPPKPVKGASASAAAAEVKPAVAGVKTERGPGWVRTDITIDGPLRSVTRLVPTGAAGSAPRGLTLALLAGGAPGASAEAGNPAGSCAPRASDARPAAAGPGHVFVWDPAAPDKLSRRGEEIPAGSRLAAGDVEGDGSEDLLVLAEGRILLVPADGGPTAPLVTDRAIGAPDEGSALYPEEPVDTGSDTPLRLAVLGSLRTYGRKTGASGETAAPSWGLLSETPLPVEAVRRDESIALTSPWVKRIPGGGSRYISAPQAIGTERLLVRLIDPQAAEAGRSLECWSKLPAPERLLEWQVLQLDGKPVLLVTTMTAEKLSLFGEKLVRVFPLAADRTRGGAAPLFAVESGMNLWQPMHPVFRDADGDGRTDLVLGYWKGMSDSTLVFETYLGEPGGGFRTRARTESFDVKGGEHSFLSLDRDVTGDGAPDAVIAAGQKLCVYAGAPHPESPETLFSKRHAFCAPLPPGLEDFGELQAAMGGEGFWTNQVGGDSVQVFEDLDGDGRSEILLIGIKGLVDGTSTGRVSVIRFE